MGKLLNLIAHALEERAPFYVAGGGYTFHRMGQPLLVDRPTAQTFTQEVRGEQVLHSQAGDNGILKSAEFSSQE